MALPQYLVTVRAAFSHIVVVVCPGMCPGLHYVFCVSGSHLCAFGIMLMYYFDDFFLFSISGRLGPMTLLFLPVSLHYGIKQKIILSRVLGIWNKTYSVVLQHHK